MKKGLFEFLAFAFGGSPSATKKSEERLPSRTGAKSRKEDNQILDGLYSSDAPQKNISLISAIQSESENEVLSLLDNGANVNMASGELTPLRAAVLFNKTKIVSLLLERGADINSASTNGYSALMIAADFGYYEIVKILTKKGANINQKTKHGWTPLLKAASGVAYRDARVIRVLIDFGSDVNAKPIDGWANDWTPLMLCAFVGDYEMTEYLVKKGAKITQKNSEGLSALSISTDHKKHDFFQLLFDELEEKRKQLGVIGDIHMSPNIAEFKILKEKAIGINFTDDAHFEQFSEKFYKKVEPDYPKIVKLLLRLSSA